MQTKGKVITGIILFLVIAFAIFFYFRFYFVFGDGVKAGELNQFTYKGVIFKTYEGKLIQAGFRGRQSGSVGASVESYIFDFSVTDKEVAEDLMNCSGKMVELHYKEYFGRLPWRGMQTHIVDKVISVSESQSIY